MSSRQGGNAGGYQQQGGYAPQAPQAPYQAPQAPYQAPQAPQPAPATVPVAAPPAADVYDADIPF